MPRIFDNLDLELLPALRDTLEISQRSDFCVRFTAEELDFILNYDIKYRLGRATEGEEDIRILSARRASRRERKSYEESD
jgi:hypothetical protein